jgi:hypothetical protein
MKNKFISLPQISKGVPSVFDRQCVEFYAFFYAAMYLNAMMSDMPIIDKYAHTCIVHSRLK